MQYVIRRKVAGDPPQVSAWFRLDGWIIAPEGAAFFSDRADAEQAVRLLSVKQPTAQNGKVYEYFVEPRQDRSYR